MTETRNESIAKNTSVAIRALIVVIWSLICGIVWFLWVGNMSAAMQPGEETGTGIALLIATGCTGGAWFLGLIVIGVIYWIIRR